MRRAQISTTDFIFALFVFFIIIIMITNVWTGSLVSMDESEKFFDAFEKTYISSTLLTKFSGYPEVWNYTSVEILGLAEPKIPNTISPAKFSQLLLMDQSLIPEKLGVPDYKVYIRLEDMYGSLLNFAGQIPSNQQISTSITSYVIYNNELSRLRVTLWR